MFHQVGSDYTHIGVGLEFLSDPLDFIYHDLVAFVRICKLVSNRFAIEQNIVGYEMT